MITIYFPKSKVIINRFSTAKKLTVIWSRISSGLRGVDATGLIYILRIVFSSLPWTCSILKSLFYESMDIIINQKSKTHNMYYITVLLYYYMCIIVVLFHNVKFKLLSFSIFVCKKNWSSYQLSTGSLPVFFFYETTT